MILSKKMFIQKLKKKVLWFYVKKVNKYCYIMHTEESIPEIR